MGGEAFVRSEILMVRETALLCFVVPPTTKNGQQNALLFFENGDLAGEIIVTASHDQRATVGTDRPVGPVSLKYFAQFSQTLHVHSKYCLRRL